MKRSNVEFPVKYLYWDPASENEFEVLVTQSDFDSIDYDTITVDELLNKVPIGLDMNVLMGILIDRIRTLQSKVKDLENDAADRIILEEK